MAGTALLLCWRHDGHRADGLQYLGNRGESGSLHAVVVGDEDAVGRGIGSLPSVRRDYQPGREQNGKNEKCGATGS